MYKTPLQKQFFGPQKLNLAYNNQFGNLKQYAGQENQ